jgi:hypothetical protein
MKLSDEMKASKIDLPIFSNSYNAGFKMAIDIYLPKVIELEKQIESEYNALNMEIDLLKKEIKRLAYILDDNGIY